MPGPRLLTLPDELLFAILQYVESDFFWEDKSRLTVCKKWYHWAKIVWLQDVRLGIQFQQQLLRSSSPDKDSLMALIGKRDGIKRKGIDFQIRWNAEAFGEFPNRPSGSSWKVTSIDRRDQDISDVLHFISQHCRRVTDIKVSTHTPSIKMYDGKLDATSSINWNERWPKLSNECLRGFILALSPFTHLRVLELDIPEDMVEVKNDIHLCTFVPRLLPTLRRFRCRLSRMCPQILNMRHLRPNQAHFTGTQQLDLEELVINIRRPRARMDRPHVLTGKKCPHATDLRGWQHLWAFVMGEFQARMRNPKLVRLLSYDHCPNFGILYPAVFDAILDQSRLVPPSEMIRHGYTAWDEKPMDDTWPDIWS